MAASIPLAARQTETPGAQEDRVREALAGMEMIQPEMLFPDCLAVRCMAAAAAAALLMTATAAMGEMRLLSVVVAQVEMPTQLTEMEV